MTTQSDGRFAFAGVSPWERIALASGLGYGALMIGAGISLPMPPPPDDGMAMIATWIQEHCDALLIQSVIRGFAAVLQVIFVTSLVGVLRRAEADAVFRGGSPHPAGRVVPGTD